MLDVPEDLQLNRLHHSPHVTTHAPSVVQIDAGKYYWLIALAMAFATAAVIVACMSWWVADKAEREARMLEYYIQETDQKLVAHNVIKPEESFSAKKQQ